jgi:hypothetical protein
MNPAGITKSRKFKQGLFTPTNPDKYKGTHPIIYRSSYELKLFRWCDHNPSVVTWGSESIIIPYQNPLTGNLSRYFVDNNITIKNKEGKLQKFLIEVKPSIQTRPPVAKRHTKGLLRKQAEYIKNQAKWKAANEWAKKHNYTFTILTEKELGI